MWCFSLLLFCGVNECSDSTTCPAYATCTDTAESYYCTCKRGFLSSSGLNQFTGPGVECNDVDECANPRACPENTTCHNSLGSYSCVCNPGFESSTGNISFHGPGGTCKAVPFKCKEDMIPNNEQVQRCQVGAALGSEYVPFCALMNATFSILDGACAKNTTIVSLERTAEKFASVIEKLSNWSSLTKDETSTVGTVLLESVESTVLAAFLKPSANSSQTIRTEFLDIESKVIEDECTEENMVFNMKAGGNEMKIGCSTIKESKSTGVDSLMRIKEGGLGKFNQEY
ncbi:EGF-like module-containing mucin-like hormone receptor-like 1 [Pteropus alecto]|uniref:EGF-like module-containing mucin-like hormone receptor-like 1 n=1 Tax=Pteropus alecto TaxID=9402 RepID=L5L7T4_PTEAL|nr:EGF-like module-containing mucin-like hormone receptor-like 1 [Pteropus alecto]